MKQLLNKKLDWRQGSQRQRMSPFPNYMSMESICNEMKRVSGYAYKQVVFMTSNNNFHLFIPNSEHERVGEGTLKLVKKNPDIFSKLAKKQKIFASEFYKFIKSNNTPGKLKKFSNQKLYSLYIGYEKRYKRVYSHYFPVLSVEDYLFNDLRDYIFSLENNPKKAAKFIDTLITERKAMIVTQERLAALRLCSVIKLKKKWLNYFKQPKINKVSELIQADKDLSKLFNRHVKKFFWMTRDYDDPVLTHEDFILRFKNHLRGNPKNELEKMLEQETKLKREIREIIKKLGIDKSHARLFQTMREGIYYKELRKWIVSQTLYYFDPVLLEIGRRLGLSLNQVRHMTTPDVRQGLIEGKELSQELNNRIKRCVFHIFSKRTYIFTDRKADEYYNFFVKIDKKAKVLSGMGVASGIAKGPAKIVINPDSFYKVKPGDIIVTLQATPVFSHVLEIAGGLICDGGPGITSHPATLAREAGIPGVIKARMATKIMKDGEMVEVNGNNGKITRFDLKK